MADVVEVVTRAKVECDRLAAAELDPRVRRLMRRDRDRAADVVRGRCAEQLLAATARHLRPPEAVH